MTLVGRARRSIAIVLLSVGSLAMASTGSVGAVIYNSSATFSAQLGASLIDTYSTAQGYPSSFTTFTDAAMTAVLGQTAYQSTAHANNNLVGNGVLSGETDGAYCAGCNGSFRLSFGNTSFTQGGGVFGVGFDVDYNPNFNTYAFITFADNSTTNVLLDPQSTAGSNLTPYYFGVTSELGIASIDIGEINGGAGFNSFVIDNLQIGSAAANAVPEPATWTVFLLGFGGICRKLRARNKANVFS